MSGIAGVYYLDGRPAESKDVERMVSALAHRGPDGAGLWCDGSVGLGHRMLHTTPESLHETLPVVNRTGDFVLTADARIDNRAELIGVLKLGDHAQVVDSQLILAAYEKWGEHCPERLVGDFAFALWDRRQQQLFCARDHFGIRPFYYYFSDQLFAFGSEVKALFCLAQVPRRLNELQVGYHLARAIEDNATTFYRDIYRLPAAHCMVVDREGMRLRQHWSLDPSRELHLPSDEAYAEGFRELFSEAVRCRLRSAFPIGSLLSGGLDSSAVTCVARDLLAQNGQRRLHTISGIYEERPQCDERSFIQAVLERGNLTPHFTQIDRLSPLTDFGRVVWHGDEPFTSPTLYLGWELYKTAYEYGVRVVLDGVDGDTAVSYGDGYLAEMARAGRWNAFVQETKALAQRTKQPTASVLAQVYGVPHLGEMVLKGKWPAFARGFTELHRHFGFSRRDMLLETIVKPLVSEALRLRLPVLTGHRKPSQTCDPIIDPGFAARFSLQERIEAVAAHRLCVPKTAREEHHGVLASGVMPFVFELANRTSSAFSIEARHPFSDRRLIEFCLALPPDQKLSQGWTRVVMRRALEGVLPEKIQWRGGKTLNSAAFTHGLLNLERERLEQVIVDDPSIIEPYVDVSVLRETYQRYLSSVKRRSDEMRVWQAVTLALWLRQANLAA